MSFTSEEAERIQDAQLILLGISYSELEKMPLQLKADVLAIAEANDALSRGKFPGQK